MTTPRSLVESTIAAHVEDCFAGVKADSSNVITIRPRWFVALLIATMGLVGGCQTSTPAPRAPGAAPPAPMRNVDPAFAQVGWLVGSWVNERLDSEETWTPPAGGTMFGVNRTVAEGTEVFFEHLRIERDLRGRLTYMAQPGGREPATPFALVDDAEGQLVFENPEHDFPQRIIYQRTGPQTMLMHIEGDSDGVPKRTSWRMVRGVIP